MRKLSKLLVVIISLMILFTSFQPVNATSNKKTIEKQINNYMSGVKSYNKNKIQKTLINKKFKYWSVSPIMKKHIKNLNKQYYKYEIKSIKINGNEATAIVKVSFYSAYEDSKESMQKVLENYSSKASGKTLVKAYAKGLVSIYKNNVDYSDSPEEFEDQYIFINKTKIPLKKVNGVWKIKEVTSKMQYQMDCATTDFIYDFSKNPLIIF